MVNGSAILSHTFQPQVGGVTLLAIAAMLLPAPILAHPGGLNSEGCHNNRKTGEYHCHRGGGGRAQKRGRVPQRLTGGAESAYYPNCAAARAAGAAPLRVGDPGYRLGLDRDRDGIACE